MIYRKERLIGVLEFISTFLLVYFNWQGFYNLQKIENKLNWNLILGALDGLLYFILLISVSKIYFLHMNPVTTLYFYIFKRIKYKTFKNLL